MMLAYVVEKVATALNDRFVEAGLDRVVPKMTNAEHTISEEVEYREHVSWRPRKPLQSMVNRADFPGVVGGARSSHPVERSRVCDNGSPQRSLRVVRAVSTHTPLFF